MCATLTDLSGLANPSRRKDAPPPERSMKNITPHGIQYLQTYLRDYADGRIDGGEVKALLSCCFYTRRYGDRNE